MSTYLYAVIEDTGKDFYTSQDRENFYLLGFATNLWVVQNNAAGLTWINKYPNSIKTKEEMQELVNIAYADAVDPLGNPQTIPTVP